MKRYLTSILKIKTSVFLKNPGAHFTLKFEPIRDLELMLDQVPDVVFMMILCGPELYVP